MFKKILTALISSAFLAISTTSVFAHVIVSPNQVGVAKFQTFAMGVPNEKDNPTVGLRLVMPEGLKEVSVTVKPGWKIETKKTGEEVTEIDWSGGSVPAEQRDDFTFSAQVPATQTTLTWKVYQTYSDGAVVSWDQDPASIKKGEEGTPYSTTSVVNDLTSTTTKETSDVNNRAMIVGGIALVLAVVALGLHLRKH